jgi:hypothetical protein
MPRAELILHKQFEAKRTRGEWFFLSDDDVRAFCAYESLIIECDSIRESIF